MNILFAIRSKDYYITIEETIKALAEAGHTITLLFDDDVKPKFPLELMEKFASKYPKTVIGSMFMRKGVSSYIFTLREVLAYGNYLRRKDQSEFYKDRWRTFLPLFWRNAARFKIIKKCIASDLLKVCINKIENGIKPEPLINQQLLQLKPDVLVATPMNIHYAKETEYVKSAKALNIPTVSMILTWDNLTTKGLLHIPPDITLAWNSKHAHEAALIHSMPSISIVETGVPRFDIWFKPDALTMGKKEFYEMVGIKNSSPYLLYLSSSISIAADEAWLIRQIDELLRHHSNPELQNLNIVIRPHPGNSQIYNDLQNEHVHISPKRFTYCAGADFHKEFFNAMQYSIATFGINTSAQLDAVINDKPCLTLIEKKYSETQNEASHFQHLLEADVLEVATNAAELIHNIKKILLGDDSKKAQRQKFREIFIRPNGIEKSAAILTAKAIEMAADKMKAENIQNNLREM